MDPQNDDNDDYNHPNNTVLLVKHSGTRSCKQEEALWRWRPELLEFIRYILASARGDDNGNNSNNSNNNTITSLSSFFIDNNYNNNNNNNHGRVTMIPLMAEYILYTYIQHNRISYKDN